MKERGIFQDGGCRINRNILECKSPKQSGLHFGLRSINRNILECKFECILDDSQAMGRVLIETYWNVNNEMLKNNGITRDVLIETYWNVNDRIRCQEVVQPPSGINRNILECKCDNTCLVTIICPGY